MTGLSAILVHPAHWSLDLKWSNCRCKSLSNHSHQGPCPDSSPSIPDVFLKTVSIEHFRGIDKLTIELDRITVLIGENNTGKTSILDALFTLMSRALGRRAVPFSEYDYHLTEASPDAADAPPLVLTVVFEEAKEDEWVPEIDQIFDKAIQVLDDNRKRLAFRVTSSYDKATRDFAVDWVFLDRNDNPLLAAKQMKLVSDLQTLAPVFLLGPAREASQHFHAKSSFWGPFTKSPQIDEKQRRAIETQVEQINQSVLDSHKPFEVVRDRISQTGKLLPLAAKDIVRVEAIPARILDMLARTQVKISARSGVRLPVTQHGAGTQSLSVLFLFEAFLQSRLTEAYDKLTEPILALEEPESHLHPSAIRALWSILDGLRGQKLISTHSGDLLAAVPLNAIRRLARRNGKVEVFRVKDGVLDERETRKVTYHVRAKRGALLFSRCWLLVEGETEFTMLPEFARMLGHDFELEGLSCVEFAQCGLVPLVKVAKELGIEWHVFSDGDKTAQNTVAVDGLRGADQRDLRLTCTPERDIEHSLWEAGYGAAYEAAVDAGHRHMVQAAKGTDDYVTQTIRAAAKSTSKPYLAYAILAEANRPGSPGVPLTAKRALETVSTLAMKSV